MKSVMAIKESIYKDCRVIEILEKLGCHHIKPEQNGDLFVAGLPDGDNKRSVQIKNNVYLNANIRSRSISGIDIIGVISYVLFRSNDNNITIEEDIKNNIPKAIEWIESNFKLRDVGNFNASLLNLGWVYNARGLKYEGNKPLDPKIALMSYIPRVSALWIKEGINYDIQKYFNIMFSPCENQIIIPIYDYENNLIGVKARNLDMHTHTMKYIYDKPCNASANLYGLNFAKTHIQEKKAIILFEAEKSVMKGLQYGYNCCVALGCKDITSMQISLIQKFWNKEVRIFIGVDKDVYYHDNRYDFFQFFNLANMFPENMKENIYFIMDTKGYLDEKDAPVDKGKKIFDTLLSHSVSYWKILAIENKRKEKEMNEA